MMVQTNGMERRLGESGPSSPNGRESDEASRGGLTASTLPRNGGFGQSGSWNSRPGDRAAATNVFSTSIYSNDDFPDLYNDRVEEVQFARHLIIKSDSFAKRNIFIRSKLIKQQVGGTTGIGFRLKVSKDCDDETKKCVEVTVTSAKQAELLSKCTKLGADNVSVVKHPKKNLVYGVFFDDQNALTNLTNDKVLEGLQDWNEGVVAAEKLGQQGQMWKITYEALRVPSRVHLGIGSPYKVEKYIPQPLRCFKCQTYGHTATTCRGDNPYRCQRCGIVYEGPHDYKACKDNKCECTHCYKKCTADFQCYVCKGPHQAGDKTCPEQKFQKDVNYFIYRKELSRRDAVREATAKKEGTTYTSVTARPPGRTSANNHQPLPAHRDEAKLNERLESLEGMFRAFLTATPRKNDDSTGGQIAALSTKLDEQQKQINDMQNNHETQIKKFQATIAKGNAANEELQRQNQTLKEENEDLRQQVRDLMVNQKKASASDDQMEVDNKKPTKRSLSANSPHQTKDKAQKVTIGANSSQPEKNKLRQTKLVDSSTQPPESDKDHLPPPPLRPGTSRNKGGGGRGGSGGGGTAKS